jgi:hypothetical protein
MLLIESFSTHDSNSRLEGVPPERGCAAKGPRVILLHAAVGRLRANNIVSLILPKCYVEIAWTFVNMLGVGKD